MVETLTVRRRALIIRSALFAVMAVIVVLSVVWGRSLQTRHPEVNLGAAPLVGSWRWRPSLRLLPAILLGSVVVAFGPLAARRARFGWMVVGSAVTSTLFAVVLASADGANAILAPVVHPTEYYHNLDVLPPARDLLRWIGTREFLVNYSVHLKGHPPGFILLLKALHAIGLGRPAYAGALSFFGCALMIVGVLTTVRSVSGETAARRVAPFLVLAPFAVWLGTSADALYSGVLAIGTALAALSGRLSGRRGVALAVLAGVSLAGSLYLTYGAVLLLPLPLGLLVLGVPTSWRGRVARCVAAGVGALCVFLVFRHFGFSWFDGLRTTRGLYWEGTAKFRPWTYFAVGNIGALLIAVGPVVAAGWTNLRDRNGWLLVAPAMIGIAIANASQMSKGEVERIWLLFMPWLLVAVASLRRTRWWLAAHLATGVVLQAWLVSKW